MNLFQKYGIKEVADVVFYTVTEIGDEEFYTPVLFLDTLKVSTLEKTAEKVEAKGGKGNKKLITWNFGKEITLNLEDALFSPASMSMIWGGTLDSKLSDYTSAIVKCNLANKYGDLHYSTKAYPSPALTDNEWEIVFQQMENLGLDSGSNNDKPDIYIKDDTNRAFVSENRVNVIKKYFNRTWEEFAQEDVEFPDYNTEGPRLTNYLNTFTKIYRFPKYATALIGDKISKKFPVFVYPLALVMEDNIPSLSDFINNTDKNGDFYTLSIPMSIRYQLSDGMIIDDEGNMLFYINRGANINQELSTATKENLSTIFKENINVKIKYKKIDDKILIQNDSLNSAVSISLSSNEVQRVGGITSYTSLINDSTNQTSSIPFINGNAFLTKICGKENVVIENDEFLSLVTTNGYAMPPTVIQAIMKELNSLSKIGYIDTDMHDLEVIDRMEKCIVKDRKGLKISSFKQKTNLFKYYADDRTSSYTIYYDAKTMLPLFRVKDSIFETDEDEFTIKMGTVYYKWTRTVKYKESENDGILGKTLVIDAETFPDAYKIVGETYIRNQKTGKDQRYQFIIHRANVSSDTSVTLEAEGDPTTFSMQVDVLTPPNDIMMELKQYDVEEDPVEGGTRIVPQKAKYTYTPTNVEHIQEIADKNEEIY